MVKVSARSEKNREKVELRSYKAKEALQLLKETATAKFNESAEAHISLKLDTKYADQQLRTTIILPQGTGKKVRIAVIAEGDKIKRSTRRRCGYRRRTRLSSRYNERNAGF